MSAGRFLSRWSQRKLSQAAPVDTPPDEALAGAAVVPSSSPVTNAEPDAPLDLPDPAKLTLESDFTAFLKEEVGEAVRRQALKKLFNDPHFNVMDGLDIYIDDYSISAPIPPDVLARLKHARELLASDEAVAGPSAQAAEAAAPAAAAEGAAQEPKPAGEDTQPATQGAVADGDDPQAQGVIQGNLSEGGQKV